MTNTEFKERLEEILVNYRTDLTQQMGFIIGGKHRLDIKTADKMLIETPIESLTQLFQDFKDAVIGKPVKVEESINQEVFDKYNETQRFHLVANITAHKTINTLIETQHQRANLILGKGE